MTAKKTAVTTAPVKKAPAKKRVAPAKVTVKPAAKSPAKPAVTAAKKSKKEPKVKVVRDSFTMPQNEYQQIAAIKETCLKAGLQVKKSEVLRAGLKALVELNAAQLKRALSGLEKIKTGRPNKHPAK
jgi:hypothetical protein